MTHIVTQRSINSNQFSFSAFFLFLFFFFSFSFLFLFPKKNVRRPQKKMFGATKKKCSPPKKYTKFSFPSFFSFFLSLLFHLKGRKSPSIRLIQEIESTKDSQTIVQITRSLCFCLFLKQREIRFKLNSKMKNKREEKREERREIFNTRARILHSGTAAKKKTKNKKQL